MRDRRPILETQPNLFSSNVRRFLRGINVPPPHPSPHSPFSIKASMILGKSGRSFKYSYENVERKPFESNESNHPSRDGGTWFLFMHRRDGGMRIKEEEKKKPTSKLLGLECIEKWRNFNVQRTRPVASTCELLYPSCRYSNEDGYYAKTCERVTGKNYGGGRNSSRETIRRI